MLSLKLRRMHMRLAAIFSAVGLPMMGAVSEVKAASIEPEEELTYNFFKNTTFTATYNTMSCQKDSSKNVVDAFQYGDYCVFVCQKGYAYAPETTGFCYSGDGGEVSTGLGLSNSNQFTGVFAFGKIQDFKDCVADLYNNHYYHGAGAVKDVLDTVQGKGYTHFYTGAANVTSPGDVCVALPYVAEFSCGDGDTTNSYTGAIMKHYGESLVLPSKGACKKGGAFIKTWEYSAE